MMNNETICAISSPYGRGAIAIIRLSGSASLQIAQKIWINTKLEVDFSNIQSHHAYLGSIADEKGSLLDEVIMIYYKSPASYTTEDMIEFFCHGSIYIQNQFMQILIRNGARMAKAGEFTLRAFINGRIDLAQAEAVADLISSESQATHRLAMQQMRGGFSTEINDLRKKLLDLSSLLELELDFSEEDVEFANRTELSELIRNIIEHITKLIDSFAFGNALKSGIPVTIAGKPNVGKSTLLNLLLNEDKAIVTEIPGTTRDAIEDTMTIQGITFRFIDTAGLRESNDIIENMGIEKTYEKIEQASVVIYMFDINEAPVEEIRKTISDFNEKHIGEHKKLIAVANKMDLLMESPKGLKQLVEFDPVYISAKRKDNINIIIERLISFATENLDNIEGCIITNSRHYESLVNIKEELQQAESGIKNNLATDLIASNIRTALHYLSEITGTVTTDDILNNIFEKFCIGK